ncbi:MAG: hypothetical protein M3M85_03720 [bacterium]|nr:hypothetical protein [bacterium]
MTTTTDHNGTATNSGTTTLVDEMKKTFADGKKILVVGVNPGNLGHWHNLDDPRLVFWTAEDGARKSVPLNTALILTTRFKDHKITDNLRQTKPAKAVIHPKQISTGELKALLEAAWSRLPEKPTAPKPNTQSSTCSSSAVSTVEYNPAKILGSFAGSLTGLKKAVEDVLQENFDLRKQVETLQRDLVSAEELVGEAEFLQAELASVNVARDDLKVRLADAEARAAGAEELKLQLTASQARAAQAESELAEKNAAVLKLFGHPPA